jgi:hypothetical protein
MNAPEASGAFMKTGAVIMRLAVTMARCETACPPRAGLGDDARRMARERK